MKRFTPKLSSVAETASCKQRSLDDVVTDFLLRTCLLRPRKSAAAVDAALHCGLARATTLEEDAYTTLATGSVAEFYIEPMLPHISDIDVMCHYNISLEIPRGHPPPTQLPAEFHNCIRVSEIIDSHLPGYVYLRLRYFLIECRDNDNYSAVEDNRGIYAPNISVLPRNDVHGPAMCTDPRDTKLLPVDIVVCVRCLSWPTQAADWQIRHRNYGWPDSATLDRVIRNGCDVVGVAHRQCRQHGWMATRQWRLSFSRAEIVLINSWMPVQQIVYHMLRYFIKTERLTKFEAGTLSNYHIKTLMLWACELKPKRWWTENVNLVRMCVQLLQTLAKLLTDARCQHYFIND